MADTDKTIKELPLTSSVSDDDDIIIEDGYPTTYRIKAYNLKSYITNEVQTQVNGALREITSNTDLITKLTSSVDDVNSSVDKLNSALAAKSNSLSVQSFNIDDQTIAASSSQTFTIDISRSGYTPLGVAGFRISTASNGSGTASNINIVGAYLNGSTFTAPVRNMNTSSTDFRLWCYIIYVAN